MIAVFAALCLFQSVVKAASSDFPSFDIFHSHCAIAVTFPSSLCTDSYQNIINTINKFNSEGDPSHGSFRYYQKQPIAYVWLTHMSKYGWASDVILEPIQNGDDCVVRGRSRTQSTFHIAGTENYCDLWTIFQGMNGYTNFVSTSCSSVPSNPQHTCTL